MPEKARILVVEDNIDWRKRIEKKLQEAGHRVVARASTLEEGLKAVEQLDKLNVQVATIDGNLGPNSIGGHDGHALIEAIRHLAPDVKTVGLSMEGLKGTTVDLGKTNVHKLGRTVTNL